ncbi:Potassium voltage beta 1 [Hyphodiscus hymeniophilus]|uniref:Potassium voltage beta 1 n=1 Tax=Hyphodiscus hymeniophilus TaxID=353542 RepID=A0A9P6VJ22_9HELO|nr:Potassium voltage beta 1 [Hyphodiscus hymeniophilus]
MQHISASSLSDLPSRIVYLSEFLGLTSSDTEALNAAKPLVAPLIPTILDAVYEKLLSFDITAQAFVPKNTDYDGEVVTNVQELTMSHPQIALRKDFLKNYLVKLVSTSDLSPSSSFWVYLNNVGIMHTGKPGFKHREKRPELRVEYIHMNALLGYVMDIVISAVIGMDVIDSAMKMIPTQKLMLLLNEWMMLVLLPFQTIHDEDLVNELTDKVKLVKEDCPEDCGEGKEFVAPKIHDGEAERNQILSGGYFPHAFDEESEKKLWESPGRKAIMSPPPDLPKMEYRSLGHSGLQVSAIALGGWLNFTGQVEDDKTYACIKAAYDVGVNFFDCAEEYQGGESERVYWGKAFGENPVNNTGLSRKHIIEGVNQSLERLGLEYVDLLYAHRPDRHTPIEETVRAFNHVIDTGKAFYWGTSEWDADEIASAWRVADRLGLIGPLMEQPLYNMLSRDKVEGEFVHLYKGTGLGLTIFSPLAEGLLTGKYNDEMPEDSRLRHSWSNYREGELEKVRSLKPIAEKLDITQATLALAWILKNEKVSSAITGASRVEHIYDSLKALPAMDLLTPDIMAEIDGVLGNKPPTKPKRFE